MKMLNNVTSHPMGHPALWPLFRLPPTLNIYTTTMNSFEPDQCNTKKSYIQKILDAYNSKQYSNILKIAHAFVIPYSTMKNCVSKKFFIN